MTLYNCLNNQITTEIIPRKITQKKTQQEKITQEKTEKAAEIYIIQ